MFVVKRGDTIHHEKKELEAYIASLLRLENVGLLLGAGASVSAGGTIMNKIWTSFEESYKDSFDWLKANNFINIESKQISDDNSVDENKTSESSDYSKKQKSVISSPCPNIEVLMDELSIAIHEWERVNSSELTSGKKVRADLLRSIIKGAKLNEKLWQRTTDPFNSSKKLIYHQRVLQKITSARQPGQSAPWVFTTNYDLAIELAAENTEMSIINGFLGIHNRHFSPQIFDLGFRNIKARGEASFGTYNIYLVKLHGSLNWKKVEGNFFEIQASETLNAIHEFLKNDSDSFELLVYPSANKYNQTNGFLFGELFRRFGEFMAKPQTVLFVVGYGFNDDHINRYLKFALLNPTLQLVIYCPEFNGVDSIKSLPKDLQQIIGLGNPRVTVIGEGDEAYFCKFADHLPDPTIYDEDFQLLKNKLREGGKRSDLAANDATANDATANDATANDATANDATAVDADSDLLNSYKESVL